MTDVSRSPDPRFPTSGLPKEDRRKLEATFPKCPCGATLSRERQTTGIKECPACEADEDLRNAEYGEEWDRDI